MRNRANAIAADVTAASTQILPPSDARRGLRVGDPSAGRVSLAFGQPAVLNAGITVVSGSGVTVRFCVYDGDDYIRDAVFAIGSGVATLPILEIIEEDTGNARR